MIKSTVVFGNPCFSLTSISAPCCWKVHLGLLLAPAQVGPLVLSGGRRVRPASHWSLLWDWCSFWRASMSLFGSGFIEWACCFPTECWILTDSSHLINLTVRETFLVWVVTIRQNHEQRCYLPRETFPPHLCSETGTGLPGLHCITDSPTEHTALPKPALLT